MPPPYMPGHPIKRPAGFLSNAAFEGDDASLIFRVEYPDSGGQPQVASFRCAPTGPNDPQEMCIVNSKWDIEDLSRDTLVAHLRMVSIISKTIPGSKEWEDVLMGSGGLLGGGDAKWFQTAVGTTKVIDLERVDERCMNIEFQRGSTSNRKTILIDLSEMTAENYVYAPSTQLLVIPGSVEKQFPGHHHDYPSDTLTQGQRDDIIDYVNNLEVWI